MKRRKKQKKARKLESPEMVLVRQELAKKKEQILENLKHNVAWTRHYPSKQLAYRFEGRAAVAQAEVDFLRQTGGSQAKITKLEKQISLDKKAAKTYRELGKLEHEAELFFKRWEGIREGSPESEQLKAQGKRLMTKLRLKQARLYNIAAKRISTKKALLLPIPAGLDKLLNKSMAALSFKIAKKLRKGTKPIKKT